MVKVHKASISMKTSWTEFYGNFANSMWSFLKYIFASTSRRARGSVRAVKVWRDCSQSAGAVNRGEYYKTIN